VKDELTFGSSKKVVSCCMSAEKTCKRGQWLHFTAQLKNSEQDLSSQTGSHTRAGDTEQYRLKRVEQCVADEEAAAP
jgi:hypothetical protein